MFGSLFKAVLATALTPVALCVDVLSCGAPAMLRENDELLTVSAVKAIHDNLSDVFE
jgi:hypothetical protein